MIWPRTNKRRHNKRSNIVSMAYQLEEINRRVREEPAAFVAECDATYNHNVLRATQKIAENCKRSRIVLLSGPSGSGKTTTAKNIEVMLEKQGITTHTISLDDYFVDVDPETSPRDKNGNYDFETPECLDISLLKQHFLDLDQGREIMVPKFEFKYQKRNNDRAVPLRLGDNEIAIFEGIHALNDRITAHGGGSTATKIYVSARSNVESNGDVVFKGTWMRITRRAIRDMQFRGTGPAGTFKMWESVRQGEKRYISPFKNAADILFDSSLPYEVSALKPFTTGLFDGIGEDVARREEIFRIEKALTLFESLDTRYIPTSSLLREFIGGGTFKY